MTGSDILEDERAASDSHQGRDAAFELLLFVLLREAGLRPRFEEPDLAVEAAGQTCLIACKRPQKLRAVTNLFKVGRKQIARHAERYMFDIASPAGIVAFSVSKLYGTESRQLPSKEDVNAYWGQVTAFVDRHGRRWRAQSNRGISGVLVHLLTPGFDVTEQMAYQLQYMSVFPTVPPGRAREPLRSLFFNLRRLTRRRPE